MNNKRNRKRRFAAALLLLLALVVWTAETPQSAQAALKKPAVTLAKRSKTKAVIQIKKQSGITGYQIFLKTSKKGKFRQFMGIQGHSFTLKSLKAKKTYYIKVRAFKTTGIRIRTGTFSKVLKIGPYKKPAPDNNSTDNDDHNSDADANVSAYAAEILKLVNAEREKAGVAPLALDAALNAAAAVRAGELPVRYDHTRPDGTSPDTVLEEMGYSFTAMGENIEKGYPDPQKVMEAWMASEGHRANILSPSYTKLGVGYCEASDDYGHYWVQLFSD